MTQQEKNRFSLWDYPQLIDYLQHKARDGWQLVDYHEKTLEFKRCEPKPLKFAVSFYPEYVAGETKPYEKLEKLWEIAALDGWQHITGNYHTQVFYNENINVLPLHTDAVVQLENYDSIIKKQYLKKWKICAVISAAALALFVLWFGIVSAQYKQTGYITFTHYALLGIMRIFVPYTFWETVYNLVKIFKYKKWHKAAFESAKDTNNFIPLRAYNFSDKINLGISIGAIIGLIMQVFAFISLGSFAKDAIEYMLNNPTA